MEASKFNPPPAPTGWFFDLYFMIRIQILCNDGSLEFKKLLLYTWIGYER